MNEKCQPSKATWPIEDCLKNFVTAEHLETGKKPHLKRSNLTKLQHNSLNFLRNNEQCAIFIADKNVKLSLGNRKENIATIINQHFGNANTCEIISKEQAQ